MAKTYCWRRIDFPGIELMHLSHSPNGIEARSTIVDGASQFSLRTVWKLDSQWRSRSLELTQHSASGEKLLHIERDRRGWVVDDKHRPDLAECLEIDVSATPFCNGLALHALSHEPSALTALYVDASDLSVQPSRQRYEHIGPHRWRYVDLGVANGFSAVLDFDEAGIVTQYEGLFERV